MIPTKRTMLASLGVAGFLTACSCGAGEPPVTHPASTEAAPSAPASPAPSSEPAAGESPSEPASAPPPGADRCEGLVGPCGGWEGCVMVRADPTTPGGFVGVGPNTGHLYAENHDCHAGVCNEVCTGGSLSGCRAGVTERIPAVCSAAQAPSRAPFTCWMRDGACVQGPDPSMMPAS